MILSPEVASKIAIWREKAKTNTLTRDEMREAVKLMRADRVGAAAASTQAKAKKAKAEIPSGDDLLKELMGDLP